jgi:hypothetical protein
MDRTREHHVKQSKPGSERQRLRVFFHMWKTDLKDKCIYKCKHDHIHIYMENMCVIVGLFGGTQKEKEKKRMIANY